MLVQVLEEGYSISGYIVLSSQVGTLFSFLAYWLILKSQLNVPIAQGLNTFIGIGSALLMVLFWNVKVSLFGGHRAYG